MTREETIERARKLRESGRTLREIAADVGVSVSTAHVWVRDMSVSIKTTCCRCGTELETAVRRGRLRKWCDACAPVAENERKRSWEKAHDRQPCVRCGGPRGPGAHRKEETSGLCLRCRRDDQHTATTARRSRIAELWNAGKTLRAVAAELGSTPNSINVELVRMRRDGWDVPPHYAARRERVAA